MERFKYGQLASGCWCVWCTEGTSVNVSLPTREEAEKLISTLKSREAEDFDLPAYLLGSIYPQMDDDACEHWNRADAESVTHDLRLDGMEVGTEDVYEIIAEFIRQDMNEL